MTTTLDLVADVGGTNTRVALSRGAQVLPETIQRFRNSEHGHLNDILKAYLGGVDPRPEATCVAVAGPVRDGTGRMTNLAWTIDGPSLAETTGASRVSVLNDLQAQGYALGDLPDTAFTPILPTRTDSAPAPAPRLVVGLGTGFNIAVVLPNATGGLIVTASEAGHMNLAATDPQDFDLFAHLEGGNRAAVESVLSGRGLAALHGYVSGKTKGIEVDGREVIARAEGGDDKALKTIELFLKFLGSTVGDLALSNLPFGGIYLVGSVSRAVAPFLKSHGFTQAFADKGRFSGFMQDFPLAVVEDDFAALWGCARHLESTRPTA